MFTNSSVFSFFPKKPTGRKLSFGWEITVAVLVKFLLLWGLWWLFFAGNKQPVDGDIIASKIFGAQNPSSISKQNKEHLR